MRLAAGGGTRRKTLSQAAAPGTLKLLRILVDFANSDAERLGREQTADEGGESVDVRAFCVVTSFPACYPAERKKTSA